MRPFVILAFLSCAAAGCGSPISTCESVPCPSGGAGGTGGSGGSGGGARLQSGVYRASNFDVTMNDCLQTVTVASLPVLSTDTALMLGDACDFHSSPQCDSSGYLDGSGPYATPLIATYQTLVRLPDGCTHLLEVTTHVTITGDNTAALEVTHRESDFSSSCSPVEIPGFGECTQHYTLDLAL